MNTQVQILSRALFARNRFALTSMSTRFGGIEWFVADAERLDSDGMPDIIYQGDEAGARALLEREEAVVAAQDDAAFA